MHVVYQNWDPCRQSLGCLLIIASGDSIGSQRCHGKSDSVQSKLDQDE